MAGSGVAIADCRHTMGLVPPKDKGRVFATDVQWNFVD